MKSTKKTKKLNRKLTIHQFIDKTAREIQELYLQYKIKVPLKRLKKELLHLHNLYVSMTFENNILTVQTENISPERLWPMSLEFNWILKCIAKHNEFSTVQTIHADGERRWPCLGYNNARILRDSFKKGYFANAFEITEQLLRS